MKVLSFFKKYLNLNYIFPFLAIVLVGIISFKNYVPGTWLSGWDTLHPEFDFSLYFRRIFSGVWQEHQGVGAVASQAHAAEIPRLFVLYLISLISPISMVRYVFYFLSLGIGVVGVYFLCNQVLLRKESSITKSASFLSSMFYLFNLTTVQHFYVPLEMFAVCYAVLPWLFFLAVKYLKHGRKKDLIWFSILTIFSASMAHTPTLFYVYFVSFCLYLLFHLVISRKKTDLKRGIILVIVTIILNLYWALPNIYYVLGHSKEVSKSRIHQNFSEEAFLQSKAYGDIKDLALQKNFLFNWREYDFESSQYVDLLDEWETHLNKPYVELIGYIIFSIALLGILVSFKSGSVFIYSFIPLFVISVFFWINSNPPFEAIFDYLRNNFSLFKEGLRFPFTKFSILLILSLSVFFSSGISWLLKWFKKIRMNLLLFCTLLTGLIYFGLPILKGNLISPSMKVKIPQEYFRLFNWFKNEGSENRVALLPLNTYWGWNFYSWDYQGAGFSWFGIGQPTFNREFDRWSSYNESFYNQASFALYSGNRQDFEKVLEKYQVKHLLLDESIINTGDNDEILFINGIKKLVDESQNIWEAKKEGFLTIYETSFGSTDNYVWAPEQYKFVDADLTYSQVDSIYSSNVAYVQDKNATQYPFVNLDSRMGVEATFQGDKLLISNIRTQTLLAFDINEKTKETFDENRGFSDATNCDLKKLGSVTKKLQEKGVLYEAFDGGVSCDYFYYPQLKHNQGYVLRIKGENKQGRGLKIYLFNPETKRMDLEELLPEGKFDEYFFILPTNSEQEGYTLNIETRSFGRISSANAIESIEFVPFPYEFLQSVRIDPKNIEIQESDLKIQSTKKIGTSIYKVKVEGKGILVLGQGYEKGWIAISNNEKLNHTKVNNWQNGWFVNENQNEILIIFWPQSLEWGGLLMLIIVIGALVFKKEK